MANPFNVGGFTPAVDYLKQINQSQTSPAQDVVDYFGKKKTTPGPIPGWSPLVGSISPNKYQGTGAVDVQFGKMPGLDLQKALASGGLTFTGGQFQAAPQVPTAAKVPVTKSIIPKVPAAAAPTTSAVEAAGLTKEALPNFLQAREAAGLGRDVQPTVRNLTLEEQNLKSILTQPQYAGANIANPVTDKDKALAQFARESINIATYGTPNPQFLSADELAKLKTGGAPPTPTEVGATIQAPTRPVLSADELATLQATLGLGGQAGGYTPGAAGVSEPTPKLGYESILPEVQKYLEELRNYQTGRIGETYGSRFADVASQYDKLRAEAKAGFGVSGSPYGFSTAEQGVYTDITNKQAKAEKELAQAEALDMQNAALGIQSNYLEAKKADITNQIAVDTYNIEASTKFAKERADIGKTLADTQAVLSNIANTSRDDARLVIKDLLTTVGGAGLEQVSEADLRALEQKSGWPTGSLTKNLQTIKEAAAAAGAEKPKIEMDPKTGAVIAAWIDGAGNLVVKKEGQKVETVGSGVSSVDDWQAAMEAYYKVNGKYPTDKQDQQFAYNQYISAMKTTPGAAPSQIFGSGKEAAVADLVSDIAGGVEMNQLLTAYPEFTSDEIQKYVDQTTVTPKEEEKAGGGFWSNLFK